MWRRRQYHATARQRSCLLSPHVAVPLASLNTDRKGTVMGYARHIGRVGALAVTLGVGAAIANTPGIAYADTRRLTER